MFHKKINAGLAGVIAGQTAICTVGSDGGSLNYRGYSIEDLVKFSTFEETAYLLIYGILPNPQQLAVLQQEFIKCQAIPQPICNILEQLPATSMPMDILRTSCSVLSSLEPESVDHNQQQIAISLIPYLASCLFYWYNFATNRKRINVCTGQKTIAGHLLALLNIKPASAIMIKDLDQSLILYAEHEFNASTFAARVCVSTGTDFYSPITAAIATLSGPLHGGANEAAIKLIKQFADPDLAEQGILKLLGAKQLIMGFGHRVYKISDPRSQFIKNIAQQLATDSGKNYYDIAQRIEQVMWREKHLFPNLDFYSSLVYDQIGFSSIMFTPLFAIARVPGWAAHIMEQRANNKLIRPNAEYIGPRKQVYVPLDARNA